MPLAASPKGRVTSGTTPEYTFALISTLVLQVPLAPRQEAIIIPLPCGKRHATQAPLRVAGSESTRCRLKDSEPGGSHELESF